MKFPVLDVGATVPENLQELIAEVDAECRRREIPMLGPHKAMKMCQWIGEVRPRLVVEVGTAIGYSALWIANVLGRQSQGRLITLEMDAERAAQAGTYFRRAGLDSLITQKVGDARNLIADIAGPMDVLFLDGGFENYYPCFMACKNQLRKGALLIADNAFIGAAEMADYLQYVREHYPSRTEWFETDLSWNPRDAMEVSTFSQPGEG